MWHSAALVLAMAAVLTVCEALAATAAQRSTTIVTGVFPAVGALVAWRYGPRLSPRASYVCGRTFLLLAVVSAALSVYNWRGTAVSGAMAFHFVLGTAFAAVFFSRRDVAEFLGLTAVSSAAALFADGFSSQSLLVWLLTMLGVIGSGLVLSAAMQAMDALSYRDPLTGAANRRAWDLAVSEALGGQRNRRHPLSVLLVDIDDFKSVNDTAGHDGGDAVLRAAVNAWRQVTRSADTLARLGGDEFGMLLLGCDLDAAERLALQLLHDLRQITGVSCSIGVATVPPSCEPALLLATADAQLYAAKGAGKGCVRAVLVAAPGDRVDGATGHTTAA